MMRNAPVFYVLQDYPIICMKRFQQERCLIHSALQSFINFLKCGLISFLGNVSNNVEALSRYFWLTFKD